MNNYTSTQKLLHRLALSSRMMREVAFDVEHLFVEPDPELSRENHVFIAGLARSGTTILLRELHATGQLSSLTYRDMPFVMSPNLWSRLRKTSRPDSRTFERAHGDGLQVNYDSPEAFEEVFWRTFDGENEGNVIRQMTCMDADTLKKYQSFVGAVTRRYGKRHYLSKNNSNVFRLNAIRAAFPHATILIPFRFPIQHAGSLLLQHERFRELQRQDPFVRTYMDWLGHNEFGLNYRPHVPDDRELEFPDEGAIEHWLEQWLAVYEHVVQAYDENSRGVMPVCYEDLCDENGVLWQKILTRTDLRQNASPTFTLKTRPIAQGVDSRLLAKCEDLYGELKSRMNAS